MYFVRYQTLKKINDVLDVWAVIEEDSVVCVVIHENLMSSSNNTSDRKNTFTIAKKFLR